MSQKKCFMVLVSLSLVTFNGIGWAADINGKDLYDKTCAACHQADGSGVPTLAPALHEGLWKKLGNNASSYIVNIMLSGMAGVELDGESYYAAMPGWSSMNDAEISAIGNYILSDLNGVDSNLTPEFVAKWRMGPMGGDALKLLREGGTP